MIKLGIDLDGVLGNFSASFTRMVNQLWPGRLPEDYQPSTWLWEEVGLSAEEIVRVWELIKTTPNFWMDEVPYYENVGVLSSFLLERRLDSTIYYITSRVPTYNGPSVMVQTQTWLDSWGLLKKNTAVLPVISIAHNHDNLQAPPKKMIVDALGLDAHVDDYLPTVREIGEKGYLLDRGWNRTGRSIQDKVVATLADFLSGF